LVGEKVLQQEGGGVADKVEHSSCDDVKSGEGEVTAGRARNLVE